MPIVSFRIKDEPYNDDFDLFLGDSHWFNALSPSCEKHINELADKVVELLKKKGKKELVN